MNVIKEILIDTFIHYDTFEAFLMVHNNKRYIVEHYCAGSEDEYIGVVVYDIENMKYISINNTFEPNYNELIKNGKWQDVIVENNERVIKYYKQILYEN